MSFRVVAKVLRYSEETLARRLILIVLAEAAWDDGVVYLEQKAIAKKARLSRPHVAEKLREMEVEGVLETRKAQRGRKRISVYRVVLPGLDEPDYERLPFALNEPFTTSDIPTPSDADDVRSAANDGVRDSDTVTGDHVRSTGMTVSDPPSSVLVVGTTEPSLEPEPLRGELAGAPKRTLVDDRDLAFDALGEACGIDPAGNRRGQVAAALNGSAKAGVEVGIRELVWRELDDETRELAVADPERFERFLARRIQARAAEYQSVMRGALLTPTALAKWWTDLPAPRRAEETLRYGRGQTVRQTAEMFGLTEEMLR